MPLKFLSRKLLPHTPPPEAFAGIASFLVGALLLALKFYAYHLTGSAAIFSDAMESIVNVLAAAFALYSLAYAHRPADDSHPYGHGKIEFLAAGFEGGMIFIAALIIAGQAVISFSPRHPPLKQVDVGLVLMLLAMVVNGLLGIYLIRLGKKSGSLTLEADGRHLMSDAVTSAATVVALLIVHFTGWYFADPITALILAVYITVMGVGLMRRSAAGLMDEQDLEDQATLRRILDSHTGPSGALPRICSYHKLRHRHTGRYHWVDFHIMLEPTLSIDEGHNIASKIEHEIEQALGEGNATAHIEPCNDQDCSHNCTPLHNSR